MLRGIKKGTLKDENNVCDRTDMYNFYNIIDIIKNGLII